MSKAITLLNQQYTNELEAAYRYNAMSYTLDGLGLKGLSKWMFNQHTEELEHAKLIYDYMMKVDLPITFLPVHIENDQSKSAIEVFKKGLASEVSVTKDINAILEAAIQEKNYSLQAFLQWFVVEQDEEEEQMRDFVQLLQMIANDQSALLRLDHLSKTGVSPNDPQ